MATTNRQTIPLHSLQNSNNFHSSNCSLSRKFQLALISEIIVIIVMLQP